VGVLLILVCIPLLLGKVRMNPYYGIRLPKAFLSEENWYRINAYGAQRMMLWSVVLIALGFVELLLPFHGKRNSLLLPLLSLAPAVVMIPPMIEIFIYSRDL